MRIRTADNVREALDSFEFRIGSWDHAPHDAGVEIEARILRDRGLIDDKEYERRTAIDPDRNNGGGLCITI
ncbi:MAG: hypothetical protein AAB592_02010 [Patescibacteria group bacterium]